jgi:23S rRNA pseudouridine1911/1915/1917 synthase
LVEVNNKVVTKSHKVSAADVISYIIEEKEVSKVTPEKIPLDIVYEDDDMIVINKPQGMVVHPAPGSPNNTFVNALLFHLGEFAASRLLDVDVLPGGAPEEEGEEDAMDLPETPEAASASPVSLRPGVVHRLDKGTSGVLLAGKHPEAVAKLSALFAARKVTKLYLAVCVGHPGDTTIVEPIGRSQKNRQLMAVYDGPPGKPAVTHIKTLAFDGKLSVALVRIETGRTHQIRVHLKERRTPIAGDEAYGNNDWNKKLLRSDSIERPLLHAYETRIEHPFSGKQLTFRAPLPSDMAKLVKKLSPASPLLDSASGLLLGETPAVQGRVLGAEEGRGFVPMDRLVWQEDEWTALTLPETD